jgi:2-keto-4-pentenoate hydratase/2-oxohepta-3-ene-1,7-dioic acid hydratase in catechol pathway
MKYCRFEIDGQAHYGLVEAVAGAEQITRLLLRPPEEVGGDMEDLPSKRMDHLAFGEARLLAPVRPSKIVCVGRNYREHAAELAHEVPVEPLLFFKPGGPNFQTGWTTKGNWES